MGKASSSKKVARAARAGGTLRERPKLGYPLLIVAIIVVGVAVVVFSRAERVDAAQTKEPPVANKDHWHTAYGIYVCDKFLPPLTDVPGKADTDGVHTHGDGVMHVHPYTNAASGTNANLGKWAEMVGMKLGDDWFEVNGVRYANGFDCNGQPANVYVIRWDGAFDPMSTGEVFTSGFPNVRFKNDMSSLVFAVVPESQVNNVPRPDSTPQLNDLEDVPKESGSSDLPTGLPTDSLPTGSLPTASLPTGGVTDPSGAVSTLPIVPSGDASPSSAPVTTAAAPPASTP